MKFGLQSEISQTPEHGFAQRQEAQRIVVKALKYSNSMIYQDLFFQNACKSDFLVCVSYDIHFVLFCALAVEQSNTAPQRGLYQGIVVFKMLFILICISVALLYPGAQMRGVWGGVTPPQ